MPIGGTVSVYCVAHGLTTRLFGASSAVGANASALSHCADLYFKYKVVQRLSDEP